jgi:hypothetical protein
VAEDGPIRVSESELGALIQIAASAVIFEPNPATSIPPNETADQKEEREEQERQSIEAAEALFRQEYTVRLTSAFDEGRRSAISKEPQDATNARSIVLCLVVGALVDCHGKTAG